MNSQGDILPMSEVAKKSLLEQKDFTPIPQEEFTGVESMNRKDRRAWYRKTKQKKGR